MQNKSPPHKKDLGTSLPRSKPTRRMFFPAFREPPTCLEFKSGTRPVRFGPYAIGALKLRQMYVHFSVGFRRCRDDRRRWRALLLFVAGPGRVRLGLTAVDRRQKLLVVQIPVGPHRPRFDVRRPLVAVPFHRIRIQQHPVAVVVADLVAHR